ncbi:hypothetical protein GQ44DRAFT_820090 [Phaeosphaeriaceae sp. PMI808]|nr:hypothetical protein GQ44DRAFT_820090 [Phaeosphaeriaceae sp. PMI808]
MADNTVPWETAKRWLVALTADLKDSSSSPGALLTARKDIASALTTGQNNNSGTFEHRFLYSPGKVSLAPSKWSPYEAAKPPGTPTPGQMIVRQTQGLPSDALRLNNWPETRMNGLRPILTHGLFLDSLDRTVRIDVFRPSPIQGFGSPSYIYTTSQVTHVGLTNTNLGRGTVWVRADLFTKSDPDVSHRAPENTFFGLSIQSGTLIIPFRVNCNSALVLMCQI